MRNVRAPGGNGTRPRKAARRNAAGLHDQQRRENRKARRKHRLAAESVGQRTARQERLGAATGAGVSALAKAFEVPASAARPRKPSAAPTPPLVAIACGCGHDGHGPHWVRRERVPAHLKPADQRRKEAA